MISQRVRENRRLRALKLPKNIERIYKEAKCRDCAVVVTRMDFAKILGKFTKVKIQYESSTSPKTKKVPEVVSPNSNARLKSNENGMVLLHRNAYNPHPVKELLNIKKPKPTSTPRQVNNVLKENNRLKKTPVSKDKNSNITTSNRITLKRKDYSNIGSENKQYGIIFMDPTKKCQRDAKSKINLSQLVPSVGKSILPSDDWCIDYLPHEESNEPMDDKVYDRIAAELEDLMYNEKPLKNDEKTEAVVVNKVDDFPSIMDILNDNSGETTKPETSISFKENLESNDVEAMLLGKSNGDKSVSEPTPMVVDSAVMTNLIEDVAQLNAIEGGESSQEIKITVPIVDEIENPHSPSILDEALKKGIEEHLPSDPGEVKEDKDNPESTDNVSTNGVVLSTIEEAKLPTESSETDVSPELKKEEKPIPTSITHLIFRKNVNGECLKSVTCPKNLKYNVEIEGKAVEFLGAPSLISSIDDLQVLLQIVNETELKSLYVYHN